MNRLTEFHPQDPEEIINRILYRVHKAIDENFPDAKPASPRFSKTEFSHLSEDTVIEQVPKPDKTDPTLDQDSKKTDRPGGGQDIIIQGQQKPSEPSKIGGFPEATEEHPTPEKFSLASLLLFLLLLILVVTIIVAFFANEYLVE